MLRRDPFKLSFVQLDQCTWLQSGHVQNKLKCSVEAVISLKLWVPEGDLLLIILNLFVCTVAHFCSVLAWKLVAILLSPKQDEIFLLKSKSKDPKSKAKNYKKD